MKTIKNIETGTLNEFHLFFGDIEIDHGKLQEAYDLLEDEITDEMENSPELWAGEFESDGKRYAIVGDGALTSDGEYVVAEIVDNQTLENIKSNIAQGWDTLQAIADCMPGTEMVDASADNSGFPHGAAVPAVINFDNMAAVRELASKFNLATVILKRRDGWQSWHVFSYYPDDNGLSVLEDYEDDPNYYMIADEEQVNDVYNDLVDCVRSDHEGDDDLQEALEGVAAWRDKLLNAVKSCTQEQFVTVCNGNEGEESSIEIHNKYSMMYHDNDVTIWAIGLVNDNDND